MRWRPRRHPGPRWGSSRRSPRPSSRLGRGTPLRPHPLGASILAPVALVFQPMPYHFLKCSGAHAVDTIVTTAACLMSLPHLFVTAATRRMVYVAGHEQDKRGKRRATRGSGVLITINTPSFGSSVTSPLSMIALARSVEDAKTDTSSPSSMLR